MARGYANVQFEWNGSASTVIKNLGFGKPLQLDAAKIFESYMQPYMPYDQGNLSTNIRITATEDHATITHLVKYANRQYHGVGFNRNLNVHPLATSYWDNAAWQNSKHEITKDIDKARLKYRSFKY